MNTKYDKKSVILIGFVTVILFTMSLTNSVNIIDNDTLWHIKIGEWIIENKTLPKEDIFSWIPGLTWVPHEMGFDIILYLIYDAFGNTGLVCLETILFSAMYFLIIYYNKDNINNLGISFWILSLLLLSNSYFVCRPEDLSNVLLVFLIGYIIKYDNYKIKAISIATVMLIMSWCHGGYIITLIGTLSVLLFIDVMKLLQSNLTNSEDKSKYKYEIIYKLIGIGCGFILSLTNPCNLDIYTYYFKMGSDVNSLQFGWKPYEFESIILIFVIVISLISFSFSKVKELDYRDLQSMAIVSAWVVLGIYHQRCISQAYYFILMLAYPYINSMLNVIYTTLKDNIKILSKEIIKPVVIKIVNISKVTVCLVVCLFLMLNGINYYVTAFTTPEDIILIPRFSYGVVNYMHDNGITSNYYNTYNSGGWLIFNDLPTFIDSRCDPFTKEISGVDIYNDNFDTLSTNTIESWLSLKSKYGLDYVILFPHFEPSSGEVIDLFNENADVVELIYEDTGTELDCDYNKNKEYSAGYIYKFK